MHRTRTLGLSSNLTQLATRNISRRAAAISARSRLQPPAHYIYQESRLASPFRPQTSTYATMAIELAPLPLPPSADPSKFTEFGKEVKGVNPGELTPEQFKEIEKLLYKVRLPL